MNLKWVLARSLDVLIIIVSFFIVNTTAFSVTPVLPNVSLLDGYAWTCLKVFAIFIIFILIHLGLLSLLPKYLAIWKQQPLLIIFIIYSLVSLVWTIYLKASLYELFMCIFASLLGGYLVTRYNKQQGLMIVIGYAIFSVVASLFLLLFFPRLARLDNPQFLGAWCGIFWHRNHMGSIVAFFSAVFLLQLLIKRREKLQIFFYAIFFVLSAVLVFGSRSATGILILFILNAVVVLAFAWLQFRNRLVHNHYLILAAVFFIIILLSILNRNLIFSLLGRESNLTGRTDLWADLLTHVWVQHPIFGVGFGALWNQPEFRVAMQIRQGWPYEVYFSDNGYLDFLLNIGAVGLFVFLVFFVNTGIRAFKNFIQKASLLSFFPLLIFLYVLVANISYSFLLEVDQFVWMLLVMAALWSIPSVDV